MKRNLRLIFVLMLFVSFNANATNPPGTLVCPDNIVIDAVAGSCGSVVTFTQPTILGACMPITIQHVSGGLSGTSFPVGTTLMHEVLTDACGNSEHCCFSITVNDVSAPSILCPGDHTVPAQANTCNRRVFFNVAANDDCGTFEITQTAGLQNGEIHAMGTHNHIFEAEDDNGNISHCEFKVTVTDQSAPTFTECPLDVEVNAGNTCSAPASWVPPTARENCSSYNITSNFDPGDTFDGGTTEVIYTATDAQNNTRHCKFNVKVCDTRAPEVVFLQMPVQAQLDCSIPGSTVVPDVTLAFTDCSKVTMLSCSPSSFNCNNIGISPVNVVVTDECSNTASAVVWVNITPSNTLPVELLSFDGYNENKVNKLEWITASEMNNDYFEVQRSENGVDFYSLGKVKGNGTSSVQNAYSYIDNAPVNGTNYYRLKQVDFNSTGYAHSKIVAIENVNVEHQISQLSTYPNPTNAQVNVSFLLNSQSDVNISLIDTYGRVVNSQIKSSNVGINNALVDLTDLSSGIYVIKMTSQGKTSVKRIVKI